MQTWMECKGSSCSLALINVINLPSHEFNFSFIFEIHSSDSEFGVYVNGM